TVAVSEASDFPKKNIAVVLHTPEKGHGAKAASSFSEEILGATPERHTDLELKC
ncbi:hypothetical protein GGI19_006041, partial [Coemansia pectinata]